MKKIIVFFVFGLFFVFSPVYADFILPSVVYNDTIIECTNTSVPTLAFNSTINALIAEPYFWCPHGNDTWDNLFSVNIANMISVNRLVIWNGQDPPNCSQMTYTQCKNHTSFISEYVVSFINTPTPERRNGFLVLGGTAPSVGVPLDGNTFNAGMSASVGSTFDGIGPILALVSGIILCFIIINFIYSLFKGIDTKKEKIEKIDIPSIAQVEKKFYNWNE
jgi:hypothetical protein